MRKRAFTLIELLIVVCIIALLMSILLPALGLASKRTRNLLCQTNQRGIYLAAAVCAMDHNEINFDRGETVYYKLNEIRRGDENGSVIFDMRVRFAPYYGDQGEIFNCPLSISQVNFGRDGAREINCSYGFFTAVEFGGEKNIRFGDPIQYLGRKFLVMVGDWMAFSRNGQGVHSAHAGRDNNMTREEQDHELYAFSRYQDLTSNIFGMQHYNYVFLDGSCRYFKNDHKDLVQDDNGAFQLRSDTVPMYDLPPFNPRALAHGVPEWMMLVPTGK